MENNHSATVISMAGVKGGIGKTVITDALCSYLANQKKSYKILLIDLNSQMDLTHSFKNLTPQAIKKSSIFRAFYHDSQAPQTPFPKDFEPTKLNDKVDILTSSKKLAHIDNVMRTQPAIAPYVLSHVFGKTGLDLSHRYDYILIDTHNDVQIPVQNAFVVSDYILSPVIPSKYGINSIADTLHMYNDLKGRLLNPATQQSYIHAKLYFVGNLIRFNTKASHDFMNAIKGNPRFLAYFRDRELFNKATMDTTNIYSLANYEAKHKNNHRDQETLSNEITPQFSKIMNVIND